MAQILISSDFAENLNDIKGKGVYPLYEAAKPLSGKPQGG